jgi:hypothetical protein
MTLLDEIYALKKLEKSLEDAKRSGSPARILAIESLIRKKRRQVDEFDRRQNELEKLGITQRRVERNTNPSIIKATPKKNSYMEDFAERRKDLQGRRKNAILKTILSYDSIKIDPSTKSLLIQNCLDEEIVELHNEFDGQIQLEFTSFVDNNILHCATLATSKLGKIVGVFNRTNINKDLQAGIPILSAHARNRRLFDVKKSDDGALIIDGFKDAPVNPCADVAVDSIPDDEPIQTEPVSEEAVTDDVPSYQEEPEEEYPTDPEEPWTEVITYDSTTGEIMGRRAEPVDTKKKKAKVREGVGVDVTRTIGTLEYNEKLKRMTDCSRIRDERRREIGIRKRPTVEAITNTIRKKTYSRTDDARLSPTGRWGDWEEVGCDISDVRAKAKAEVSTDTKKSVEEFLFPGEFSGKFSKFYNKKDQNSYDWKIAIEAVEDRSKKRNKGE